MLDLADWDGALHTGDDSTQEQLVSTESTLQICMRKCHTNSHVCQAKLSTQGAEAHVVSAFVRIARSASSCTQIQAPMAQAYSRQERLTGSRLGWGLGLSQQSDSLSPPGNDRRPSIAEVPEAAHLVHLCCTGVSGPEVQGVAYGGVPSDVATTGGCMVAVKGLHHYLL